MVKAIFEQPIKINENILKIATGQGDNYTTCCLILISRKIAKWLQ